RNKNKVGMRIPPWMITEEMKLTKHYKMYAEVFGLDVPLIQQSARLTPPVPVPTTEKANEMILQDTLQISLAKQKSHEEQEARENVALVYKHLEAEEIEKLVEESKNVDDSSPSRHDDTSIPEKEEETTKDTKVEPNIVIPVNVDDEDDEITDEVFELRRRAKGKNVEESRISPIPSPTRSPRNLSTLESLDTEKLQELTVTHPTPSPGSFALKLTKTNRLLSLIKAKPNRFKRYKTFFHELQGRYGYLFAHLKKRFMPRTSSDQLADNLHDVMMETLPSLVKEKVTKQVKKEVPVQVRDQVVICQVPYTACRPSAVRLRDQDDPHDDAYPKGENSVKRQKTSEYEAYVSGESSSGQVNVEEPSPSTSGNQEQDDEFDFWTDSYASDDDEIPTKQVSQDIMEEISLIIDEAKLKKMADEMLRQRCTSGDEHQKEILVSSYLQKITPLVQSCQRDPEAPALSLINQDLLYLKKGNSGPEKIVLSLHKDISSNFFNMMILKNELPWNKQGLIMLLQRYAMDLTLYIRSSVIWERVHDFQLGIESYQQEIS
ncbi:hypothetical protein Tco_1326890, partial [Tanacetum coccineum]